MSHRVDGAFPGGGPPDPGRSAKGFTLLELLGVLGLAAIMLALVLPRLGGGLEGIRVRASSRHVAAFLRSARVQAIAERRPVTVTVDPRRAELHLLPPGRAAAASRLSMPDGIRLVALDTAYRPLGDHMVVIRFWPGGDSEGGMLGVAGAGRLIPVRVDALTGRVTIGEAGE